MISIFKLKLLNNQQSTIHLNIFHICTIKHNCLLFALCTFIRSTWQPNRYHTSFNWHYSLYDCLFQEETSFPNMFQFWFVSLQVCFLTHFISFAVESTHVVFCALLFIQAKNIQLDGVKVINLLQSKTTFIFNSFYSFIGRRPARMGNQSWIILNMNMLCYYPMLFSINF